MHAMKEAEKRSLDRAFKHGLLALVALVVEPPVRGRDRCGRGDRGVGDYLVGDIDRC